jgi:tetratricopeptide (TPR) repeat protein
MNRKLFGNNHHLVASALVGLGSALANQGNLVEAESRLSEAVEIQRKVLGNDHFDLTYTLHDLGSALEKQGKFAEAENCYREARDIRKRLACNPHGHLLLRLGSVQRKQGKYSEAQKTLREAVDAFREPADAGYPEDQNAIAWLLATDPDSTVRNGRTAVTCAEKAVAATGRTNTMYLDTLAAAYAEAGDFATAVSVQKEAIARLRTEVEKQDSASRLRLYESGDPYHERE